MQHLREFGRGEELWAFLGDVEAKLDGAVHGVSLTYDRYWREVLRRQFAWLDLPSRGMHSSERLRRLAVPPYADRFLAAVREFRPIDWGEHCRALGYPVGAAPIVIKILLRRPKVTSELPTQWARYPVRYLQEPRCEVFAQPIGSGQSVGQTNPATLGTLGGFLQGNSTTYLTTCDHVLPAQGSVLAPSPRRSQQPTAVADYVNGTRPPVATGKCNSRSLASATSVDVALCAVDTTTAALPSPLNNGIARWSMIADMTPGDPVRFVGAQTRHGTAQLADLNLWREIYLNGQPHCYGDLFTIEPRQHVYFNSNLARPGDSGAWIVYDGAEPLRAFDGMLVGGAGSRVYCSFAENIRTWCYSQFGIGAITLP